MLVDALPDKSWYHVHLMLSAVRGDPNEVTKYFHFHGTACSEDFEFRVAVIKTSESVKKSAMDALFSIIKIVGGKPDRVSKLPIQSSQGESCENFIMDQHVMDGERKEAFSPCTREELDKSIGDKYTECFEECKKKYK